MAANNERKGAYAEVEGLKQGKHRIAKDYRRFELILAIFGAVLFLFFFSGDIFNTDIFFFSIAKGFGSEYEGKFNYHLFFIIYATILVLAYLFFNGKILTTNKFLIKQRRVPSFIVNKIFRFNNKKTTMSFLDVLNTPFRLLNNLIYIPEDLRDKIGYCIGYPEFLNKNFFNQVVEIEDGYLRAKKLVFFNNLKYLFGEEYYQSVKTLFRSEEQFKDLFLIIEGYLDKGKLYDVRLMTLDDDVFLQDFIEKNKYFILDNSLKQARAETPEKRKVMEEKLKEKYPVIDEDVLKKRSYDYFQSYVLDDNGKGKVILSKNAIKIYMDDKKEKFKAFLQEQLFSTNPKNKRDSTEIRAAFYLLSNDLHFRKKIIKGRPQKEHEQLLKALDIIKDIQKLKSIKKSGQLNKIRRAIRTDANIEANNIQADENLTQLKIELMDMKLFQDRIIELLMADFSLVIFRMVIAQYMNLPAGTIVVKLESYDTRMIMEYYTQVVTINIEHKKNDGTSTQFQSDNYVNLFLKCFHLFCDIEENYVKSELVYKFNTAESAKPYTFEERKNEIDKHKNNKGELFTEYEEQMEENRLELLDKEIERMQQQEVI